ncbi:MAG: hypothetical protein EAZ09_21975 [Oscillatoriales cyanobacterium]|nr:MAG: hypothetical protein EAZ18_18840 [Oscillatoriales cyanobacterium]TAH16320.1 MAG: hypothetical protein EAZ09_21975 [Oscillatoriales cyanobacterium]
MIAFTKLSIGLLRYILMNHLLDRPRVSSPDLEQSPHPVVFAEPKHDLLELIGFCRTDIYD